MTGVRTRLFSLTVGGNTIEFMISKLDRKSFKFYKTKHVNNKSAFYKPVRSEWGLELGETGYSIHHKQDL